MKEIWLAAEVLDHEDSLPREACAMLGFLADMKIEELIDRHPEKMSGTPLFSGTRVPITHLFDYLEGGESLEEFLDQFPTVSREQAVAILSASRESLLSVPTNTQARIESMRQAVKDELFKADLSATMEDFRDVDLS